MASKRVLAEAGFDVAEAAMGKSSCARFGRVSLISSFLTFCCPGWEANKCCKLFAKTRQQPGFPLSCLALSPNVTVKD